MGYPRESARGPPGGRGGALNRKILVFSIVTLVGVLVDQVTKYVVRTSEAINAPGGVQVIPGFFSIVHAENPGAAFGMLGGLSEGWRVTIFVIFTVVAGVIVLDMFRKLPPGDWFLSGTLGLILSGALGNAIDRVYKPLFGVPDHRGGMDHAATVTDFFRFYTDDPELSKTLIDLFGMAEYPSFNVADANLLVGVVAFLIHYLFFEGRGEEEEEAEAEADEDAGGADAADGPPVVEGPSTGAPGPGAPSAGADDGEDDASAPTDPALEPTDEVGVRGA